LEVQEAILAKEQKRELHPPDGRDLSAELGKTRARVDRINGEHAIDVMGIFNALVSLGLLPVQDVPQLQNSA
jgi:hypothetical protein